MSYIRNAVFGFVMTLFAGSAFGLTAPYLISATALSDSSVQLQWRNNDVATQGFIIQRKDSNETAFHSIDSVKSATQLTYTDMKGLLPTTLYTYQVIAYNTTDVSAASNNLQAATTKAVTTLISVTALTHRIISLNWRNKGKTTQGFIIQRRDSTDTLFHFIDSILSATIGTFTDSNSVQPGSFYWYRVIAYNAMGMQDTSNRVIVWIQPDIFKQPAIFVSWDFETSSPVKITIYDSSNCETGYRIYRDDGFTSTFNLIATIASTRMDSMETIKWYDNTVAMNQWYNYKVAVYNSDSSIFSNPCSTYTLRSVPTQNVVKFQKLGEFPVSPIGWSAKVGDSIIFKENPSPAGKYSVINVKDPANQKFDGYIDSTALLSFPLQTLIPVYMNFMVSNKQILQYKDRILVSYLDRVEMYQIQNSNLVLMDTLLLPAGAKLSNTILLNDTILAVIANETFSSNTSSGYTSFLYSAQFINSGFSFLSSYSLLQGHDYSSTQSPKYTFHYTDAIGSSYIHGEYNGTNLISESWIVCHWGSESGTSYDSTASVTAVNGIRKMVFTWKNPRDGLFHATNTGFYFSPTENLCISGTNLFVSDIRVFPDGYRIALANNAVYSDSAAGTPQNILLDTLTKRIYLIYSTKLSILSYQRQLVGITNHQNKPSFAKEPSIISNATRTGITIILPTPSRPSDLYFYDLSGRCVDKLLNVTSNAVLWRPKTRSLGCYIVSVKCEGKNRVQRFMVR